MILKKNNHTRFFVVKEQHLLLTVFLMYRNICLTAIRKFLNVTFCTFLLVTLA
jgi:hypothetical protein